MAKNNKYQEFFKTNKKTIIITVVILLAIIFFGFLAKKYIFKSEPKQMYDVLVIARDKKSKSASSSSLKPGDVLMARNAGMVWSKAEIANYLILKMELTDEQQQKLTAPVDKNLTEKEINKELESFKQGREDIPEEELTRFREELENRRETVLARKYKIDLENLELFSLADLPYGQPYPDEIFSWKIVDKK